MILPARQPIIYPLDPEPHTYRTAEPEAEAAPEVVSAMGHRFDGEGDSPTCTNRHCVSTQRVRHRRLSWLSPAEKERVRNGEMVERRKIFGWNTECVFDGEICGVSWLEHREHPAPCQLGKDNPDERLPDVPLNLKEK